MPGRLHKNRCRVSATEPSRHPVLVATHAPTVILGGALVTDQQPSDNDHVREGLLKAGLPEYAYIAALTCGNLLALATITC